MTREEAEGKTVMGGEQVEVSDLISRQAAIKLIEDNSYLIKHNLNDVEKGMTLTGIKQALEFLPSVQPEQKTGRWVTQFDGTLHYCSECGWALMDTESGDLPYMGIDYHRSNEERWTCCPGWCEELMNYCPNCGAKMEGVK